MEGEVATLDFLDQICIDDIDVDAILQGFPEAYDNDLDLDQWLSNSPSLESESPGEPEAAPADLSLFADEVEKFLLADDDGGEQGDQVGDGGDKYLGEFLADVLVDGSGGSESEGNGVVASPDSNALAAGESDEGREVEREEEEEDEQVISKKRMRQMRNRESAMQSRERKKVYVKELEMKSKYLESECRRLDYALRCCMAENMALNQRLQRNDAPVAGQESAVLFVESLLLGSLFWLVSIAYLFLLPGLQILRPKEIGSLGGRGLVLEVVVFGQLPSNRALTDVGLDLVITRRRCRGLRTRMKSFLFPLHGLSAGVL